MEIEQESLNIRSKAILNTLKQRLDQIKPQDLKKYQKNSPYLIARSFLIQNKENKLSFFTASRYIEINLKNGQETKSLPLPPNIKISLFSHAFYNFNHTKIIIVYKEKSSPKRASYSKKKPKKIIKFVEYNLTTNTAVSHFLYPEYRIHNCEGYKNFLLYSIDFKSNDENSRYGSYNPINSSIKIFQYFPLRKKSRLLTTIYLHEQENIYLNIIPDFKFNVIYIFHDSETKKGRIKQGAFFMDLRVKKIIPLKNLILPNFGNGLNCNKNLLRSDRRYVMFETANSYIFYDILFKRVKDFQKSFRTNDIINFAIGQVFDQDAIQTYNCFGIFYKKNLSEENLEKLNFIPKKKNQVDEGEGMVEEEEEEGQMEVEQEEDYEFLREEFEDFLVIYKKISAGVSTYVPVVDISLSERKFFRYVILTYSAWNTGFNLIRSSFEFDNDRFRGTKIEYQAVNPLKPDTTRENFFTDEGLITGISLVKSQDLYLSRYRIDTSGCDFSSTLKFKTSNICQILLNTPEADLAIDQYITSSCGNYICGIFEKSSIDTFFLYDFENFQLKYIKSLDKKTPKSNHFKKLVSINFSKGGNIDLIYSVYWKIKVDGNIKNSFKIFKINLKDGEEKDDIMFSMPEELHCFVHNRLKNSVFPVDNENICFVERVILEDEEGDQKSVLKLRKLEIFSKNIFPIFEDIEVFSRGIMFTHSGQFLINTSFDTDSFQIYNLAEEKFYFFQKKFLKILIVQEDEESVYIWGKNKKMNCLMNYELDKKSGESIILKKLRLKNLDKATEERNFAGDKLFSILDRDCVYEEVAKKRFERDFKKEFKALKNFDDVVTEKKLKQRIFDLIELGPKFAKFLKKKINLNEVLKAYGDDSLKLKFIELVSPLVDSDNLE